MTTTLGVTPGTDKQLIAAMLKGPGPAKYGLPGTTGALNHDATRKKMPAFSFGKRFKANYESCSPGPSYMVPQFVTRNGKANAPAYSLYSRQPEKENKCTPAPGMYSPEKYPLPNAKQAPSYSFKGRFLDQRLEKSPAPNTYALPTLISTGGAVKKKAPSYSICGRPKIGAYYEDLQKTPGPGTYRVTNPNVLRSKGPAYSIKGRHDPIQDKVIVPGPGAYQPENVFINKKSAPQFSFGVRHTDFITMVQDNFHGNNSRQAVTPGNHSADCAL